MPKTPKGLNFFSSQPIWENTTSLTKIERADLSDTMDPEVSVADMEAGWKRKNVSRELEACFQQGPDAFIE